MKTQLLNSILVSNTMNTADLILGERYKFPYSQIAWTYIGNRTFYSSEFDTYKSVDRERLIVQRV
jgi:hypothetical protein